MPTDKKENSVADFLNNIDGNKEVFKEEVKPESESEDTGEKGEKEEKTLPFFKDPKIQRYIEKQVEKKFGELKPSEESKFRQEVKEKLNLPPALIKLVGNDTPEKREALKELSEYLDSLPAKAQEQFQAKMKAEADQVAAQDKAALEELNTGFESIEEDYGVDLTSDSKTRASFLEYLRKISHKNADGEVDQFADIPAAWEDFQERNKPKSAGRAKELASRGLTRSGDTSNEVPKGRSWKDVDRFFEKLKSNN